MKRAVLERAARVRLLIMDVDGVLTDGRLYYGADGAETKAFHAQDGSAVKRLLAAGVGAAIVTGRRSAAVERRAAELGIAPVYAGVPDKGRALDDLCAATGVAAGACAHVGDDLPDLALFARVGFAVAVPNAHPAVLDQAHYVTNACGGRGAIREVCDLLLCAQGKWPDPRRAS